MSISVGESIPSVTLSKLDTDKPQPVSTQELFSNKKIVLVAVTGAFTPDCSNDHLPGFVQNADKIKQHGIDEIVCISVNDPFVMQKWGESVGKNELKFIADSNGEFMKSSELMVDLSAAGLGNRLSRFSMLVDD